jgi:hypothetical protein
MRKLTLALAIALLATVGFVVDTPKANAAVCSAKVVIVVGQTQGDTQRYIDDANALVPVFTGHGACVTTVYSPNATWAAVKAAAKGANVLVYMGHGSGWPNPYPTGGPLKPMGDNGMGLNDRLGTTNTNTYYYGESYMAQLELAPNAMVFLNHLCYASGNNEQGRGLPDETTARTRVEGYASGFMRAGAGAVLAEGLNNLSWYVDQLFNTNQSIDSMWQTAPTFNNSVKAWWSTRNPSVVAEIDPSYSHPASDGDVYYRSLVVRPGATTTLARSSHPAVFVPASGSFYPINPTVRLVDSRPDHAGPTGKLAANGVVNYQITGGAVPAGAIGITANLTVTRQTSAGSLYIAPTIDSGSTMPASTINFPKSDNRANGITVGLTPQGTVAVYFAGGSGQSIDFILDVTGYFLPGTGGAGYNAFGPQRVLDTRYSEGATKFYAGHHQTFRIAGVAGLPASGIVAVVGNLTIVRPSVAAFVYLGPNPTDVPTSSTLNFPRGDTRANNIIIPVNPDGTLSAVFSGVSSGSGDLLLDISGYFTATGGYLFNPVMPSRILDSRAGVPLPGPFRLMAGQTFQVAGFNGVAPGAAALVGNLVGTNATCNGYASIGPKIDASLRFSNVNYPVGDTRANGVTTPLTTVSDGTAGQVTVVYGGGCPATSTSHMFLDVYGYYLGGA